MNKRLTTPSILALLVFRVLGCASGSGGEIETQVDVQTGANPPMVDDLRMLTAPVVIGEQAFGRVYVEDLDGLVGLVLRLEFDGPATGSSEATIASPGTDVSRDEPIDFTLLPGWPEGEYTVTVTATDSDGFESAPVSTSIVVDASPGDLGSLTL